MDAVFLSRLQFALATYFHFLFVPLTLGLSVLLVVMETLYVRSGSDEYKSMARFFGRIFLINFVVGVVTGIPLEFQFGTNWSRYSRYVGDVFGPLLAIEATVAFFMESTFIAVWALGWKKLSPKMHLVSIWLVAFASNVSAVWILIANSWMQHPVGFVMKGGKPVLADLMKIVTQEYAVLTILHTLAAAYVLAGFFVMGVSAYHLLKRQSFPLFTKAFRIGLTFATVFSLFAAIEGHMHGADLARKQPAKLASLESHWDTSGNAPVYLIALPDETGGGNSIAIGPIPGALSILAFHRPDAVVTGLKDIPKDQRPPVTIVFLGFRIMVTLGMVFIALVLFGWLRLRKLESSPGYLKVLIWAIPLPYLACEAGWTVTEVGRLPWIVYGLMKVSDAASKIAPSQVFSSLILFLVVYGLIGVVAFKLIRRAVKDGPEPYEAALVTGKEG